MPSGLAPGSGRSAGREAEQRRRVAGDRQPTGDEGDAPRPAERKDAGKQQGPDHVAGRTRQVRPPQRPMELVADVASEGDLAAVDQQRCAETPQPAGERQPDQAGGGGEADHRQGGDPRAGDDDAAGIAAVGPGGEPEGHQRGDERRDQHRRRTGVSEIQVTADGFERAVRHEPERLVEQACPDEQADEACGEAQREPASGQSMTRVSHAATVPTSVAPGRAVSGRRRVCGSGRPAWSGPSRGAAGSDRSPRHRPGARRHHR